MNELRKFLSSGWAFVAGVLFMMNGHPWMGLFIILLWMDGPWMKITLK